MIKSDEAKKVFGAIVILAIIVSVFGGVVSAVDLSGVTQSVTDVKIQTEVDNLSSEESAEAFGAVTDDVVNIEFVDQSAELGVVSSRSSYDPQVAVNYADSWWNGRNPNYHDYSSSGGDCANFVSQCLIAGGLDLSVCDSCTWIDDKGCLPRCRDLHTYLVDYLHATWETKPRGQVEPLEFVPGDPAIFGYSDAHPRTHAVFAVTGDATHYATCNAHSSDAYHVSIENFYNANPSFDRCTFYHIPTVQKPTVETRSATSITETAATLNGEITDDGGASIDERGLLWGEGDTLTDLTKDVTISGNHFSFCLTGLKPDTKYSFMAYAKNSAGTGEGNILSFRTECPTPGTPNNPSPNNHATDVAINTDLDWSDCSNTDFYDVYFGTSSPPPYYGSAPASSYPFQNDLDYNTKYYWKIEAKNNCGGITQGPIWDFTTIPPQRTITFYTDPTAGGTITFDGSIYSNGQSTTKTDATYSVSANPASNYEFDHWSTTSGVSVANSYSQSTTATVSGDGSIKAWFSSVPETGSILVSSSPSGANIYLDGSFIGQTLYMITNVPAGMHTLKLTLGGYYDWSTNVEVTAGETSYVDATLSPITPQRTITFYTDPTAGGTITFDGSTYSNEESTTKQDATYSVSANPASNYVFDHWSTTSGVNVSNPNAQSTTATVSGDGSIKAWFNSVSETVVSIEDASAPPGGTVTVPIKIADVENMCGASIWLNYNKDVVIVDSVSDGDLVPLTHSIDNPAGVTKINWDTTSGMTGDFVFAYVTLEAVGNQGDTCLLDLDVKELYDCVPPFNEIPRTVVDGTFEVIPPLMEGDVTDLNVCVSLKDSTLIKFYLVDMATLTPHQLECADTNDDGEVTLKDSTAIKFWLVVPDFPLWESPADDHMMEPVPCSAVSLARSAASTTVSIEDASAPQGGTVTVPIKIVDVENMCGANIWLNYNKDVVIVDSVSDGDLVPLTHNIDNTAGVTKMNWDTTSGMTGDFVFAYVTLKAVGNSGDTCLLDLDVKELYDCVPPFNEIPHTVAEGTFTVRANIVPKPDLIITEKWLCWPDNCTICYNVMNIGDGTAPAGHNTTLYADGVEVAHDPIPVDLAPGESYTGCFDGYIWTYTPPSDNITVCADNNKSIDELDEDNNCLTNIWMCGDVNCDGRVTMSDVRKVFNRYLDPIYPLDLPWAADVNCDGRVTMSDVRKVFNRYLDLGYELECCCEDWLPCP